MPRLVRLLVCVSAAAAALTANAQVPDLMNAFQAGTKAMAMGGASAVTDTNTLSPINNPATLAFIDNQEYGIAFRNLPSSTNTITGGSFANRSLSGSSSRGRTTLTQFGFATPIRGGSIGISYSVGGFIDDTTTGDNLVIGNQIARNIVETTRAQTNYLAVAIGRMGPKYNVGYGLVLASQSARATESYTLTDGGGVVQGSVSTSLSGDQLGVGAVIGIQAVPRDQKLTWGASLRTPIRLSGSGSGNQMVSMVPGQISVGAAQRRAAKTGSDDFWIFAAQADYLFGGSGSDVIARKNTLGYGFGAEYNLLKDDVRIPLRVGYRYVPASGSLFRDRSELTAGLGYRPLSQDYGVDLSIAKPTAGGPIDFALSVSYKPRKG